MRTLPTNFNRVSDLTEIIFANRNKSYGAYELRKHYNDRLLKAFLGTIALLLLLLLISFAMHRKPTQVKGDHFRGDPGVLKTFTFKDKGFQQPRSHPKPTRTDQPPTVIVNDTASEHKEKPDTTTTEAPGNNSSLNNDSGSPGDNTEGTGIAVDTFSQARNTEPSYRMFSEVMPSFPGGDKAFSRYIQRHFDCSGENISGEGKIILRFIVMKDGSITIFDVKSNNVAVDCVNAAKNLLLNCPKWNPGLQNNQPVNVMLVLPISIQKE